MWTINFIAMIKRLHKTSSSTRRGKAVHRVFGKLCSCSVGDKCFCSRAQANTGGGALPNWVLRQKIEVGS